MILFLLLGILFFPVFSYAGHVEDAIDFKRKQIHLIEDNNVNAIFLAGKRLKPKSGDALICKDSLIEQMSSAKVTGHWLEWFKRRFRHVDKITIKAFTAAIFFPYELVETSHKYHISQMNCAFKACVYYSSLYDPSEVGGTIERSLKIRNFGKITYDIIKDQLSIILPFNTGNFISKARDYLESGDNLVRLYGELMAGAPSIQLLNFARLLKDIKRDDLAESALIKANSEGAMEIEGERLLDWLDITFISNNAGFIEKAKAHLIEHAGNFDRLSNQIMSNGTATQLLNFGSLLKNMGRLEEALSFFRSATSRGSKRAELELAYYAIENQSRDLTTGLNVLGYYGSWKIAQCFRYGKRVKRDLKTANQFYLEAINGSSEFPEIAYDAGDFVEELAISQKDKKLYERTARNALVYFQLSGDLHLGFGYIRVAELMIKARELYSSLRTEFNDDIISDFVLRAANQGAYTKANTLIIRYGLPLDTLLKHNAPLMGFIAQINERFGE